MTPAARVGGVLDSLDVGSPVQVSERLAPPPVGRAGGLLMQPGHYFGRAVSVYKDLLAVGGQRRIHVYSQDLDSDYHREATLRPPSGGAGRRFGRSLDMWGDWVMAGVVSNGAPSTRTGAIHVYRRSDDWGEVEWSHFTTITPADSAPGDRFGHALMVTGDTLIVGAPGADNGAGAVYVFVYRGGQWLEQARLENPSGSSSTGFATSVAVFRDRALVGAPGADGAIADSGLVFGFRRDVELWRLEATVTPHDPVIQGRFGHSLALTDGTAIIGAPGHAPRGSAYLFRKADNNWREIEKLAPEHPDIVGFGAAVMLHSKRALVGSEQGAGIGQRPRLTLFRKNAGLWAYETESLAAGLAAGDTDAAGTSGDPDIAMALSANTMIVGVPGATVGGDKTGAVDTYALSEVGELLNCPDADTLGALATCIRSQMPRRDSEGYVIPTAQELADWRVVINAMLHNDCAVPMPDSLLGIMQLSEFQDAENGKIYCLLMEVGDQDRNGYVDMGWGTFIVDFNASRELSQQAPHPYNEADTAVQAVEVFKATNSRTYLMAGAHRNSNNADSVCDPRYEVADCAHSEQNMYHWTTIDIDDHYDALGVSHGQLQWHGMADSSCPELDVYLSPGVKGIPDPTSNVVKLKDALIANNPSWGGIDVPGQDNCNLHGTRNIQGRQLNGVAEALACTQAASSSTYKWMQIEQVRAVRSAELWAPAIIETWPVDQPPADATVVSAVPGNGYVAVRWCLVHDATNYELLRSTTEGGPYTVVASSITGLDYLDTAVTNGTTYYYRVRAVNSFGTGPLSNEAAALPSDPPPAPTGLIVVAGNGNNQLNWSEVVGAWGYNVWRSTSSGFGYEFIATGLVDTAYIDRDVSNGTRYYYVVTAMDGFGESPFSAEVSAQPDDPPAAPSDLSALAGNGFIDLAWTLSAGAIRSAVYRRLGSGTTYELIASDLTTTSYRDTGVQNGETYYYVVTVGNSFGDSGYSNEVSEVPEGPPPAPTGVTAESDGNIARIAWDLMPLATSHQILRSGVRGGPYTTIATGVTATSYDDTNVTAFATYYYVVVAVGAQGASPYSDEVAVEIIDPNSCHDGSLGDSSYCSPECPCSAGQGDCDGNDECEAGLSCVQNVGASYGWDEGVDVCEATCHTRAPGHSRYCTSDCPCADGEGDCDSDSQCVAGTRCISNVGAEYGWSSGTDVCEATCHPSRNGGWSYCSPDCPCDVGEGDCDRNDDCLPGLRCVKDRGAEYGFDEDLDMCEP